MLWYGNLIKSWCFSYFVWFFLQLIWLRTLRDFSFKRTTNLLFLDFSICGCHNSVSLLFRMLIYFLLLRHLFNCFRAHFSLLLLFFKWMVWLSNAYIFPILIIILLYVSTLIPSKRCIALEWQTIIPPCSLSVIIVRLPLIFHERFNILVTLIPFLLSLEQMRLYIVHLDLLCTR